nr:YfhO family protein [Lachnospiraceae bacterium]
MTESGSRKKSALWIVAAALLPVLITSTGLFVRNVFPGQNKSLVVYGDYIAEYLPFFYHFWDALFHGKSLEYSFSLGLGSPTLAMYSIFAFSPFSIIAYFIKDATLAGYISWMLKLSLISVSLMFFLIRDLKSRKSTALLFSLFYSLSSYVLIYHNNIHFLDILYILPVLMHFLILFVKEDKQTGLIFLYTYCFINNFFNGFCTGFFSFVVYILLLWYFGIRGDRLKKNVMKYCLSLFIAVLLSLPVILPAIMFVYQHMPVGSDFSVIPLRSVSYIINSLLFGRKIRGIFDTMPALYCGWPSVILCLTFFLRKEDKRKKILVGVPLILLLICCFWHPAYYFMHLCNEPDSFPWRFSYLLSFLFVCIAAWERDHSDVRAFSTSRIVTYLILLSGVAVSYYLYHMELASVDLIPISVFAINIAIILLYFAVGKNKKIFCLIAVAELISCVYLQLPYSSSYGSDDIREEFERADSLMDMIEKDGPAFYRSSVVSDISLDQSLIYDYPGTEYFCSFDNEALINALAVLGLQARPQQYSNYGNTEFTNMILDIKYSGSNPEVKLTGNSPVLPLAFSVSEDIRNVNIGDNPFDNQQALADAMTEGSYKLFTPVEVEMSTNIAMELENDNEKGSYSFTKTAEGAAAAWYLKDPEMLPAYLYVFTGIRQAGVFDNESLISGDPVRAQTPISLPILNKFFKDKENGKPVVYLKMNGDIGSKITIVKTRTGRLNTDELQKIYEELAPLGLEIDSFRDDRIHGTVRADEAHNVLFSSIPYDLNWHIYIDGKEQETFAVFNGAFLACDLTPGVHEVE